MTIYIKLINNWSPSKICYIIQHRMLARGNTAATMEFAGVPVLPNQFKKNYGATHHLSHRYVSLPRVFRLRIVPPNGNV